MRPSELGIELRCPSCGWEDMTATRLHHLKECPQCGDDMEWWDYRDNTGIPETLQELPADLGDDEE